MELTSLYDKNRKPLNKQVDKYSKFEENEYMEIVHVCIFNEKGEMLIQQRTPNKKWGNKWDISVGGCVTAGETSNISAEREIKEEDHHKLIDSFITQIGDGDEE